jgi:hypothetical protein
MGKILKITFLLPSLVNLGDIYNIRNNFCSFS